MIISVETPVFKGKQLQACIDSVLDQGSSNWTFSLLWDGGDAESRGILEELKAQRHPNVSVHFGENRGIARARRFLTEHSRGDFILPLDDDDALPSYAIERFLRAAERTPWASVIRARRHIVDEQGKVLDTPPWFPFEPRHYRHGMVTDLMNHSQPYLIRRSAYDRTSGWEGFADFSFAGEDCDIYLKLEERGTVELLDEELYYYRVHPNRLSLVLTSEGGFEMWRRLADKTIARIGLPLKRLGDKPPFSYERVERPAPTIASVDFAVVGGETGATESLRRFGVAADALHVLPAWSTSRLNDIWGRTSRPVHCIVDASLELDGGASLAGLLSLFGKEDADLVAPPLADAWLTERVMLVRREVLNAVGGLDEGFLDGHAAVLDLCLRAKQREFKCVHAAGIGVVSTADVDVSALERLRRKWTNYPKLLAPTA